jgi:hypothetical protein
MPGWSPRSGALLFALCLVSCGGDDGFSPTVDSVAGSYSASAFTVTSSSGVIDLLAMGASVQVTLTPDGTTTGRLLLPGDDTVGDHDEDLAGTWILSGSKVTISPVGPSVLRFTEFTAASNQLSGDRDFSGEVLHLVLSREH